MAVFSGDGCSEAAAEFEAAFFGDADFLLGVTPIGNVGRRVVEDAEFADPMLGFDPTSMRSSEQPPMLQPPTTGGKISLTCGRGRSRPDPTYDVLADSYKRLLGREDSKFEELPAQPNVWGRLGRASSPISTNLVVEVSIEIE